MNRTGSPSISVNHYYVQKASTTRSTKEPPTTTMALSQAEICSLLRHLYAGESEWVVSQDGLDMCHIAKCINKRAAAALAKSMQSKISKRGGSEDKVVFRNDNDLVHITVSDPSGLTKEDVLVGVELCTRMLKKEEVHQGWLREIRMLY